MTLKSFRKKSLVLLALLALQWPSIQPILAAPHGPGVKGDTSAHPIEAPSQEEADGVAAPSPEGMTRAGAPPQGESQGETSPRDRAARPQLDVGRDKGESREHGAPRPPRRERSAPAVQREVSLSDAVRQYVRELDQTDELLGAWRNQGTATGVRREIEGLLEAKDAEIGAAGSLLQDKLDRVRGALLRSGRPDQLADFDAFLGYFSSEHGALRDGLRSVAKPVTPANQLEAADRLQQRLKARPAHVRERLTGIGPFEAGGLPSDPIEFRIERPSRLSTVRPAYLGGQSEATDGDLDPNPDVQITPEIQALASRLGNSASRIYEFVRDNTTFQPYFGSLKGSQATLETLAGNDYDLASLTIALLRASDIPARYVRGTVKIPTARIQNWLGVRHPDAVNRLLNSAGIDAIGIDLGGNGTIDWFEVDRVWVEAQVPHANYRGVDGSAGAKVWVPLDPAFKLRNYQAGIPGIPDQVPFDENGYLARRTGLLAYEWYQNQVRDWLQTNMPGKGLGDVPYKGTIAPESLGLLPASLPHEAIAFTGEWTELPDTLRHRYQITLLNGSGGTILDRPNLRTVQTSLSRVTVSYAAAGPIADLAKELGGLEEVPAFLASLTPQLKIDGAVDTSGSTVNTGSLVNIRVRYYFPDNDPIEEVTHPRYAGDYHALIFDSHQVSETLLDRRSKRLIDANANVGTPSEDKDALEGELLNLTGLRYWQRVAQGDLAIGDIYQFRSVKQWFEILASGNTNVLYLYDRPFAVTPGSLGVDSQRQAKSQIGIDGDQADAVAVFKLEGRNGSAQEHAVWEEVVHINSVSTIKALQFANETDINNNGLPNNGDVLTLTLPGQTSLLCPAFPASPKSSMETALSAGKIVKTPYCDFTMNQWHGVGWLEEDPATGAGAYLISGYLAGGETTAPAEGYRTATVPVRIAAGFGRRLGDCADAQGVGFVELRPHDDASELGDGRISPMIVSSIRQELGPGDVARVTAADIDCHGRRGLFATVEVAGGSGRRYYWLPAAGGGSPTCNPPSACPPPPGEGETGDPRDPCAQSGDPVNYGNGNLVEKHTDLRIPLPGPDLEVVRTYNSLRTEGGPLGQGWTHNHHVYLVEDPGVSATVYDEDGGVNVFADNGDGTYDAPAGLHEELTEAVGAWTLRKRDGRRQRFDANGRLTEVRDRNGNTLAYAYDGSGRLYSVTGLAGRRITLSYGTADRLAAITDSSGRTFAYAYDANGRLQSVTTPSDANTPAQITSYTYYESPYLVGKLATLVRADAAHWRYAYYMNGKVFQTVEPEGRINTLTYLPLRGQVRLADAAGQEWVYHYDDRGRLTRQEDPLGNAVDTTWTAQGYRQEFVDAGGAITSYDQDARGNIVAIEDPLGGTTSYTYEPDFDLLTSLTNPRTATTTFDRDPVTGDLLEIADALDHQTSYTYNARGQMLTITDPESRLTTLTYDANGYLATVTDASGGLTTYDYDALGRLLEIQPPVGGPTRYEYDVLDRVVRVEDSAGNVTRYHYDARDRLDRIDAPGPVVRQYAYDGLGRIVSDLDPLGGETRYEWSAGACGCGGDRPTALVLPDGSRREFVYDVLGRLMLERDALGREIAHEYDIRGNLRSRSAGGATVSYEHDELGRLTRRTHPDTSEETFSYDAAGNLLTASGPAVTLTFEYDLLNRMTRRTDSRLGGKTITYEYDASGLRTRMVDAAGGETLYGHDAAGRLATLRDPLLRTYTFQYDSGSRRIATLLPSGGRIDYGYDAASRLTSTTHRNGAGSEILGFEVAFDTRANPVTVVDSAGTHSLSYDRAGRLVAALHPDRPDESFAYDEVDNRVGDASGRRLVYDDAQQLVGYGPLTHRYDDWGRRMATDGPEGNTQYEYDGEERLARVELPDGGVVSYTYDPLGNRIAVDVDGDRTLMVYDDLGISTRYSGAGVLLDRVVQGLQVDSPLAVHRAGTAYDYRLDAIGSVAALTDGGHAVRAWLTYGAFGNIVAQTGDQDPVYGFTAREWDGDAGLYYYRARFYEPSTGRFLSTDPLKLVSGRNPYVYALDSPLRFTDPTGEIIPLIVAGIAVGMAVGWGSYAVATVATGGDITLKGSLGALAAGGIAGGVGVVAAPIAGAIGLGSGALGTFAVNAGAGFAGYLASYGVESAFDPCTKFSWIGFGTSGLFGGVGGYLGSRWWPTRGMSSFNQAPYFFPRTWRGVTPGFAGPNAINSIYLGGGASVAIGTVGPAAAVQAADGH